MDFKKQFDELKAKLSESFSDEFKKGLAIAVALALILMTGYGYGSLTKSTPTVIEYVTAEGDQASQQQTTVATTAATTQATTVATTAATQPDSSEISTNPPATTNADSSEASTQNSSEPASTGAPTTPAEIIALFNESANKIKTDATKVVKNFEKRVHNEEKLIIHPSIEGLANSLMEKNFKDDTTPIEYATKEDIVANYQVPGETWVSQLTEAEVAEATCNDNGTEYEITLKLHPTQNPENGVGVSKAVDTITSSEIMESAPPMVQSFETEYYDCVIKCKIDKASGRTTWSSYTTPVVLKLALDIPVVGDFDAQVGMSFEKDYTITY